MIAYVAAGIAALVSGVGVGYWLVKNDKPQAGGSSPQAGGSSPQAGGSSPQAGGSSPSFVRMALNPEQLKAQGKIERVLLANAALPPGDKRWDEVVRKKLWKDQNGPLGTTCADYFGWIYELAGLSSDCLHPSGRFRTGKPFFDCARSSGAIYGGADSSRLPLPVPGDSFQLGAGPGKPFHVGFVESATDREWRTIDGGQGTMDAQRVDRVVRPVEQRADGVYVGGPLGFRRLEWILRSGVLLAARGAP